MENLQRNNPLWQRVQRYAQTAVLFRPPQPTQLFFPAQPTVGSPLPPAVPLPAVPPTMVQRQVTPVVQSQPQNELAAQPELPTKESTFDEPTWNRLETIMRLHKEKAAAEAGQAERGQHEETAVSPPPISQETLQQPPLEQAWTPVQRKAQPQSAAEPPAEPSAASRAITPAEREQLQATLREKSTAQPTNSVVEVNLPRRQRPQPLPLEAPPVQRATEPPEIIASQKTAAPTVETEIGALPAELWTLIDQAPPTLPTTDLPVDGREAAAPSAAVSPSHQTGLATETPPTRSVMPTPMTNPVAETKPNPAASGSVTQQTAAPIPKASTEQPPSLSAQTMSLPQVARPAPAQHPDMQFASPTIVQRFGMPRSTNLAPLLNEAKSSATVQSTTAPTSRVVDNETPTLPVAQIAAPRTVSRHLSPAQQPIAPPATKIAVSQAKRSDLKADTERELELPKPVVAAGTGGWSTAVLSPPIQTKQKIWRQPIVEPLETAVSIKEPLLTRHDDPVGDENVTSEVAPNLFSGQSSFAEPSLQRQALLSEPGLEAATQEIEADEATIEELAQHVYRQLRQRLATDWERRRQR